MSGLGFLSVWLRSRSDYSFLSVDFSSFGQISQWFWIEKTLKTSVQEEEKSRKEGISTHWIQNWINWLMINGFCYRINLLISINIEIVLIFVSFPPPLTSQWARSYFKMPFVAFENVNFHYLDCLTYLRVFLVISLFDFLPPNADCMHSLESQTVRAIDEKQQIVIIFIWLMIKTVKTNWQANIIEN